MSRQSGRDLVGAINQLRKAVGSPAPIFLEDHQAGRIISARELVKPVQCEVEMVTDIRPGELSDRVAILRSLVDQSVSDDSQFPGASHVRILPGR